jgi:S-DNA-T family DNA segregation ATPase FtsK/SpoIIIE
LSEGRAQRKPVIPAHWRTREAARQHVALAAARHAHAAAYHGVRAPRYLLLAAWWALVGILRTGERLLAWWHVPDLHHLESQAAAEGLLHDHLRIHRQGRETRQRRCRGATAPAAPTTVSEGAGARDVPAILGRVNRAGP